MGSGKTSKHIHIEEIFFFFSGLQVKQSEAEIEIL